MRLNEVKKLSRELSDQDSDSSLILSPTDGPVTGGKVLRPLEHGLTKPEARASSIFVSILMIHRKQ